MMITHSKQKSLSTLIKEADTAFSEFIRLRDADDTGRITCVSCGTRVLWRQADCCHYIDRGQMSTRYDEMNAAGGCRSCNRFFPVEHKEKFQAWLVAKFGEDLICQMEIFSTRNLKKWTRYELEELIDKFKEEVKRLRKRF